MDVFLFILGAIFFLIILAKFLFFVADPIPEEKMKEIRAAHRAAAREKAAAESSSVSSEPEFRWTDRAVSLPSITQEQRELVKSNSTNWRKYYDSLQGAVVDVVGAFYVNRAGKELYRVLKPGSVVSLRPDPYNEFDDTAVKVFARNAWIGYVPSDFSEQIYAYCCLDKFEKCYVVKSADGQSLKGLQIVMLIKKEAEVPADV